MVGIGGRRLMQVADIMAMMAMIVPTMQDAVGLGPAPEAGAIGTVGRKVARRGRQVVGGSFRARDSVVGMADDGAHNILVDIDAYSAR